MKKISKTTISILLALLLLISMGTLGVSASQHQQSAVLSVEAFSIGNGYIVEPTAVALPQGENAAQLLDSVLKQNGIACDHAGTLQESYYLKTLYVENSDRIPQCITDEIGDYIDDGSGTKLGEQEYTALAGWLITVNGAPLNVGLCDYIPAQNDVIRVQFSLYYGADIGLAEAMEMDKWMGIYDFYPTAAKEDITTTLAQINQDKSVLEDSAVKALYDSAVQIAATVNASQSHVNQALFSLVRAQHKDAKTGDANLNGTLEVADVLPVQKYIAHISALQTLQQAVSDADGNGIVNLQDVLAIQKMLAKIA